MAKPRKTALEIRRMRKFARTLANKPVPLFRRLAVLKKEEKPRAAPTMPKRDVETLKRHAASVPDDAKFLSFHSRRQRSRWLLADGTFYEVREAAK